MRIGELRRRHLPHWDVSGMPIFLTACLHGSLPSMHGNRIDRYRRELHALARPEHIEPAEWERRKNKLLFAFVDELLDNHSPVSHLSDERQARIVQEAFLHFAGERYALLAFVVMPSHHHWLFRPDERWSRAVVDRARRPGAAGCSPRVIISHSVQSYTATMCNRVRGGSGVYWQGETYDHWARDEVELHRIIRYIENNPVKAGLAQRPEDWAWSSARLRHLTSTHPGEPIPRPPS